MDKNKTMGNSQQPAFDKTEEANRGQSLHSYKCSTLKGALVTTKIAVNHLWQLIEMLQSASSPKMPHMDEHERKTTRCIVVKVMRTQRSLITRTVQQTAASRNRKYYAGWGTLYIEFSYSFMPHINNLKDISIWRTFTSVKQQCTSNRAASLKVNTPGRLGAQAFLVFFGLQWRIFFQVVICNRLNPNKAHPSLHCRQVPEHVMPHESFLLCTSADFFLWQI